MLPIRPCWVPPQSSWAGNRLEKPPNLASNTKEPLNKLWNHPLRCLLSQTKQHIFFNTYFLIGDSFTLSLFSFSSLFLSLFQFKRSENMKFNETSPRFKLVTLYRDVYIHFTDQQIIIIFISSLLQFSCGSCDPILGEPAIWARWPRRRVGRRGSHLAL